MNSVVSGRGGGVSRHLARGDVHTSHRDAAARGPQQRGIKPQGYPSARPQTRLPSDTPSASRGERRASVARRGAATAGGGAVSWRRAGAPGLRPCGGPSMSVCCSANAAARRGPQGFPAACAPEPQSLCTGERMRVACPHDGSLWERKAAHGGPVNAEEQSGRTQGRRASNPVAVKPRKKRHRERPGVRSRPGRRPLATCGLCLLPTAPRGRDRPR